MSEFARDVANSIVLHIIIAKNQEEFDVIRSKIEARPVLIATPMELWKMYRILKRNDRLLKTSAMLLESMEAHIEEQKKDPSE